MRERTVRISSSGKTFSATGWKIGWAMGPAELIDEVTAVKQFLTYVSGAPFQPAVARALDEGDAWVQASVRTLQDRRDQLAEWLASVGLGRWARVLANGAQRGDVVELHSCFSRDEERRAKFAEEYGIGKTAASYEELLADPEVEGVIVTTPNDTHLDVIRQALEAGKAVYTDKPIAHTLEDANRIAAVVVRRMSDTEVDADPAPESQPAADRHAGAGR